MKSTTSLLCAFLVWSASVIIGVCQEEKPQSQESTLIRDVTIIDVVQGKLVSNQSIVIHEGRITFVGKTIELPKQVFDTTIDAKGKFAIPGLWDMHIHTFNEGSMELYPINGVVGTRVMWGMPNHHAWRKKFESGQSLGPRMVIASAIIDGKNPIWPGSIIATDKESGIQAVEKAIQFKADFAKVYSLLPREAYFAIAEKCKQEDLPFDGHVPLLVGPLEASTAGQRSMAHLYEIILGCSNREDELRQLRIEFVKENGDSSRALFGEDAPSTLRRAYETYDDEKARTLFTAFKNNGTWQCPTLTVLHNLAYLTDPKVQENPNLKYLNRMLRNFIAPKTRRRKQSEAEIEFEQQKFKMNLKIVGQMHQAGVPIVAGTDVMNPFCLPGFSLHGELQLMVEAGLTPIQALQTATINPAKFLGKESEFGTIDKGKVADIVLLDDNPLDSIANTRKINTVVIRGVVLNRKQLDAKLAALEEAAK